MARCIYLDNAATTPLDRRVRESMEPYLTDLFGNPSSMHLFGRQARQAIDVARAQVATLLSADPEEIVFTASGTEANNLALIGVLEACGIAGSHIIASGIEHPAVLKTCGYLANRGASVTFVPAGSDGIVSPTAVAKAIRPETKLISVMAANNVVGTLQPISEIGIIAHNHDILFHTDAVQAAGKVPMNMQVMPIDLLALSAHKLHGPKGVGALYIRNGVSLTPIIHGGGQENGLRSATPNVTGIVGLGKAAEIAHQEMAGEASRLVGLRDRIIDVLIDRFSNTYLIGHPYMRLPGHVCLGFSGQEGEAIKLLLALDELGIAVSSGSACSSNQVDQPSHVLRAMGMDAVKARGSLRISLGRFNTAEDVDELLLLLPKALNSLRPVGRTSRSGVGLVDATESLPRSISF